MCGSLFQSEDVTVYKLKDEIDEAANRLMFLLDLAIFPCMYTHHFMFVLEKGL
jgi:hypothetical protein